tara:strand:+ start:446 stop:898 length:453 start_codon:yes stop_codon:yes gene_type:complete
MDDEKIRGFGDNIRPDETLLEGLKSSVQYLTKIIIKTNKVAEALTEAVDGKNVVDRANALTVAKKLNDSAVDYVEPFKKVIDAIRDGENIHRYPHKSNKLDLVDGGVQNDFAQHIIDGAEGKFDDTEADNDLRSEIIEATKDAEVTDEEK